MGLEQLLSLSQRKALLAGGPHYLLQLRVAVEVHWQLDVLVRCSAEKPGVGKGLDWGALAVARKPMARGCRMPVGSSLATSAV